VCVCACARVCVTGLLLGMGHMNVRFQCCFVFGLRLSGNRAWPMVPMNLIQCDTTRVGGFCVHVCKHMEHVLSSQSNQSYGT
jgi:hypothetical protein